jgi:hypothetical protein
MINGGFRPPVLFHTIISALLFHMDANIANQRHHVVFGTAKAAIYPPGKP